MLISSTNWENFFRQRCHPAAMPEFRIVAEMIRDVLVSVSPTPLDWFEWHTPYLGLNPDDEKLDKLDALKVSVGRCARTSYLTHDGQRDVAKDIALYEDTLAKYGHWSPLEHVAVCVPHQGVASLHRGNFKLPWYQMRQFVEDCDGGIQQVEALVRGT
jgi:thymidylate synthase ThyX